MKSSMIAMSLAALLAFGSSFAAPAASPASPAADKTAQQSKMSSCAAANKGKKGDDYKKSMSDCLKAKPAPAPTPMPDTTPPTTTRGGAAQQSKMATCASANKGKKGDDYKNAMSACLKASPASEKK